MIKLHVTILVITIIRKGTSKPLWVAIKNVITNIWDLSIKKNSEVFKYWKFMTKIADYGQIGINNEQW